MLKYLLDTNVISELARVKPNRRIARQLRRHESEIAISSVTWHELRFGAERLPLSRRREAFESWLERVGLGLSILDYDRAAAEWHARERARLVAQGLTPSYSDGQIAAIAATQALVLVTFNETDFRRFKGLRVVNWGPSP